MEVISLASAAVALIAPYLKDAGKEVAKAAGQGAVAAAKRLYDTIKARFASDSSATMTLAKLAAAPDDKAVVDSVRKHLERLLTDGAFAAEVQHLVAAARSTGDQNIQVNIEGPVGKQTNIGTVNGNVTF